jgi:hypothetical protein
MLKYLDDKADRIGDICRLDKADIDSLRYSNQQLDIAENMLGDMRNQIERPILEEGRIDSTNSLYYIIERQFFDDKFSGWKVQ